ncbi:MAG: cytochrome P460 family protein [Geobacteraceae bacterium]|nr:cytochrome P460 family protein [Geobacteraceae bacterium]
MKTNALTITFTSIFALLAISVAAFAATMSLPKGYEKWAKSKQQVVNDKKSIFYGIHYTYVDAKAMKAYKSGGKYPEGSQFVVVQYGIKEEGGKPVRGKKSMIVLMKKDKKQKETGGWLFAGFTPEGKPSGIDPVKNCYECHVKEASDRGLVISRFADFR